MTIIDRRRLRETRQPDYSIRPVERVSFSINVIQTG